MTKLTLSLELRFVRIPIKWAIREGTWSERGAIRRYVVPSVRANDPTAIDAIDGWDWRRRFLQMKHTEKAALNVLEQVGLWDAVPDHAVSRTTAGDQLVSGAFGSRYFTGRAVRVQLEEFWQQQKYWLDLLRSPVDLKARFGPRPANSARPFDKLRHAVEMKFLNELTFHVEWRKGLPTAVIECITGREALVAMVHFELLQRAKYRNCKKCGIPYPVTTEHETKFCGRLCAQAAASKAQRQRNKARKKIEERDNGNL